MGKRRLCPASIAVLAFASLCLAVSAALAQENPPAVGPSSSSHKQLDLATAGYQDLSAMARRSDAVNVSLNFLDDDHVLFTFNPRKMFERLPDCPRTHDDRLVHAAVFELSTGKVVKQADWYLHDARRYLWSLGPGKLLLRRLNSFYVVDSSLQERLLWKSPKDVLWASVTPDGKQIILETPGDAAPAGSKENAGSKSSVRIEFLDAATLAVERTIRSEKPVNLEATSTGFASVTPGLSGKVWLIRFGASERDRTNIARVRSRRAPDVSYLSANTLLIGRDSTRSPGYSVSAFTVTGNRLWRQHWDAHRYTPVVTPSADGSRFAISTLKLIEAPKNPTGEPASNDSEEEGLEQRIQVLNAASGDAVLSVTASPVVLSGLNYALSPDGRQLILLRGTSLEFYQLPEMSPDEQARYTAVKADVPGLYVPPAQPAKEEAEAGPVFTSAAPGSESAEDSAGQGSNDASRETSDATKAPPAAAGNAGSTTPDHASADTASKEEKSAVPIFKSSTQVVALDVVVTDGKGHTVKGVPRQDFMIKEDGRPQTVGYFDEVSADKPPTPSVEASAEKHLPPNIFTNNSPSHDANAVTLILYDELNTPIVQQREAKLELLKFLQRKPKGASFAFCVLSKRLQMVQGFTPDESLLMRAAKSENGSLRYNSILTQDAQNQQTVDWLTSGAMKLSATNPNSGTGSRALLDAAGLMEEEETWIRGRDLETRMWLTMDAFTQIARYLAGIPGRKSLIWLSGSFPLGIFPGVDLRNPNMTSDSYTGQVKQAVNLLAESHIALYPVDVRGLSVYSMLTPSFSNSPDTTQPVAQSQTPFVPSSDAKRFSEMSNQTAPGTIGANLPGGDNPFMQEVTEHGIMDQIAAETGGKAFYNSNGIEQAMATAVDQESNYYALSYTPSNRKYDGKFRKIKVSLAPGEKKLQVIHRSGYFAVDPNAPSLNRDVKTGFGVAAMQHGSPQSHQVLFAARVVPIGKPRKVDSLPGMVSSAPRKNKKQAHDPQAAQPIDAQHYAVDYAIAPAQLRFDTDPDGVRHETTNFMVASFDEDGTTRTALVSRSSSKLDAEGYQEVETGGLRLHQEVDLPANASFLRLGVQDAVSGRMGTIEIRLPLKAVAGVEQQRLHSMPEIEPD